MATRTQLDPETHAAGQRLRIGAAAVHLDARAGLELRLSRDAGGSWSLYADRPALLVASRGERWWYRGEWRPAPANMVRLLEAGEVVQGRAEVPGLRLQIALDDERLGRAVPPGQRSIGFTSLLLHGAETLAAEALRHAAAGECSRAVVAAARQLARLALGVRRLVPVDGPASAPPPAPGVARARAYLVGTADRLVSLAELSAVAGLSRHHLARRFAVEVGLPPHLFHVHVRLAHARRLLATGSDVAAAAHASGFADQAHLTRWCSRVEGVTPGQYRRAALAAHDAD